MTVPWSAKRHDHERVAAFVTCALQQASESNDRIECSVRWFAARTTDNFFPPMSEVSMLRRVVSRIRFHRCSSSSRVFTWFKSVSTRCSQMRHRCSLATNVPARPDSSSSATVDDSSTLMRGYESRSADASLAIQSPCVSPPARGRMFNAAIHGRGAPRHQSTDHDPLFEAHRCTANLRTLDIDEIKTVPHVPLSDSFVERLFGTMRRSRKAFIKRSGSSREKPSHAKNRAWPPLSGWASLRR